LEKKGSFFILLIIVAVLTLIIAVLAAFIVLVGINGGGGAVVSANGVVVMTEPPAQESLTTLQLFDTTKPMNLKKSADSGDAKYAQIEMSVKYHNKIEGVKDVAAMMELEKASLQEIVTTYFMEMSVEEFSNFETKALVKAELKTEFNNFLISSINGEEERSKIKEVIYDVVFSAWNYM
jgi:flagellar basal body-associated protein FliL